MNLSVIAAQAIVDLLAANGFPSAERRFRPIVKLSEITDEKVIVIPRERDSDLQSRTLVDDAIKTDIALHDKLSGTDLDTIDPHMTRVEEMIAVLRDKDNNKLTSGGVTFHYLRLENTPIYVPEHIDQQLVFTSVVTITHRVFTGV